MVYTHVILKRYCKDSASECKEYLYSVSRAPPILCKDSASECKRIFVFNFPSAAYLMQNYKKKQCKASISRNSFILIMNTRAVKSVETQYFASPH